MVGCSLSRFHPLLPRVSLFWFSSCFPFGAVQDVDDDEDDGGIKNTTQDTFLFISSESFHLRLTSNK